MLGIGVKNDNSYQLLPALLSVLSEPFRQKYYVIRCIEEKWLLLQFG
jgi:hypothetical protein